MVIHGRMPAFVPLTLSFIAAVVGAHAETAAAGPIVETTLGQLEGELSAGVRVFRGIPFAAPPVGELRWAPPQSPASWQGIRDATRFGNDCPVPASALPGATGARAPIHGPGYDVLRSSKRCAQPSSCSSLEGCRPWIN